LENGPNEQTDNSKAHQGDSSPVEQEENKVPDTDERWQVLRAGTKRMSELQNN
jgi:hypothetical protein